MTRSKYLRGKPHDQLEKRGKMRRKSRKLKRSDDDSHFVLAPKDWPSMDGSLVGKVVEVHKKYSFVSPVTESGQIDTRDITMVTVARRHLTHLRRERNFVVVGDQVLVRPASPSELPIQTDLPLGVIEHMAPRKNAVTRTDPLRQDRLHVVASNVDQMAILASYTNPEIKWGLLDRYLVLAENQGIHPIIILNKADLLTAANESQRNRLIENRQIYEDLGYQVFSVSCEIDPEQTKASLTGVLKDKITLFCGHSGVGKSSVINLFDPEIVQEVEENPNISYKGRHTTSFASFIKLGDIGYAIDTPGVRSFDIGTFTQQQLTHSFIEMRPYLGKCKYRECRHIEEPDCEIRQRVEEGVISSARYRSYCAILLGESGREGRVAEGRGEE